MTNTNVGYLEAKMELFKNKLSTLVPELRSSGMKPSIVPTTITAEHYPTTSSGSPIFKFKEVGANNGGGGTNTERLLKEDEYFMPLMIAAFYGKYDSAATTGEVVGRLFPYVDDNYFRGANEAEALRKFEQGRITVNINGHDHWEDFDASMLTTVPAAQFMLAADNATASDDVYPSFGPELIDQGYKYFDLGAIVTTKDDPKLTWDLGPGAFTNIDGSAGGSGPTAATATWRNLVRVSVFGLLYTSPFGSKQICAV